MRTIKIRGIDMVYTACDRLAQNGGRLVDISGRSPDQLFAISSCKLHGAVAHAVQRYRRARQREAARESYLFNHFCFSWNSLFCGFIRLRLSRAERRPRGLFEIAHVLQIGDETGTCQIPSQLIPCLCARGWGIRSDERCEPTEM